jgi:hypothetical protein
MVRAVVEVEILEWDVGEIVALESAQEIEACRSLRSNLCAIVTGFMAMRFGEVDAIVVLVDLRGSVAAHGEDGNAWLDMCVDENSSVCSDVSSSFPWSTCASFHLSPLALILSILIGTHN